MLDQDSIDGNGPQEGPQNNREGGKPKILTKNGLPYFGPYFLLMPIDLVHNDFFALYKPRVCNCFSGNARHYKAIEKLSFPETSVEPITNFGKIGL